MSRYTTAQTQATTCVRAVTEAIPGLEKMHEALVAGWNSQSIRDFAESVSEEHLSNAADVEATWQQVDVELPGLERLPDAEYANFSAFESELEMLGDERLDLDEGIESAVGRAQEALVLALESAADRVAQTERLVLNAALQPSLTNLGWHVEKFDGENASSFEARRGDELLLIRVTDGGAVEEDFAGLADESCETLEAQLWDEMATYGIERAVVSRTDHRDPRGGGLIENAARERAGSLGQGAVTHGDRLFSRSKTKSLHQPVRSSSSRLYEGGNR